MCRCANRRHEFGENAHGVMFPTATGTVLGNTPVLSVAVTSAFKTALERLLVCRKLLNLSRCMYSVRIRKQTSPSSALGLTVFLVFTAFDGAFQDHGKIFFCHFVVLVRHFRMAWGHLNQYRNKIKANLISPSWANVEVCSGDHSWRGFIIA